MADVVVVTDFEFLKAESVFRSENEFGVESAPHDEEGLSECVRSKTSRAVILGVDRYVGELYDALAATGGKEGAIIARFGVGHDGIDKTLARQRNITVTNTPGVLDTSVVEQTLSLMLGLARRITILDAAFKAGEFSPQTGTELNGKTLAVIGFGAIGRRVAACAHFGLKMKVLAVDVRPASELEEAEGKSIDEIESEFGVDAYTNDLDTVLRQADVVTLHMPGNPQTRNFFNADRLAALKPTALLVNTSRGSVLDECALHDALSSGGLAGAALDVFESEPYAPADAGKDLRILSNVVLTPHVASNTFESNERMARACLENIRNFFAGRTDRLTAV